MPRLHRSYDKLTTQDLRELRDLALREHERFIEANAHLSGPYRKSLLAICLCQGAASHYLSPTVGIKDFDIWHFYVDDPRIAFPYRAHRRLNQAFKGMPVDFLKRSVQRSQEVSSAQPHLILLDYLLQKNTTTKTLLLQKAIIGLFPKLVFGKIIWPGLPSLNGD